MTDTTNNKMPSRPPTAYLNYQSNQDLSGKWQKLPDKERAKYTRLHAEDKVRYEDEMTAWREAGGKEQHDVPKPKQPLTPYMFFSKEQNVGGKWRAEPAEVKDEYKKEAKKANEKYKEKIAAYEEKYGPKALEAPDWPARPLAPYMRFAQESRPEFKKEYPDLSTAQIGKKLGAAWREMSENDRQEFIDEYDKECDEWTAAIADYEAEWGDIAFIKKARKKDAARVKAEEAKEKAAAKREKEREKNKAKREREKAKEKRQREKATKLREKEREKKQKEKEQEKALRQGLSLYKRENRPRFKKREQFSGASAAVVNEAIEEQWRDLSPTTQKTWARRAAREVIEKRGDTVPTTTGKKRSHSELSETTKKEKAKKAVPATAAKRGKAVVTMKVAAAATAKNESGISATDLRKGLALYTKQERPKLKKKNPEAKGAAVTKMIKERWNKLSDKTHTKYVRQALESVDEAQPMEVAK